MIEYSASSFTIADSVFGTCFFFGTGLTIVFTLNSLRFFSNKKTKLSPYWLTAAGFTDGEWSFRIRITKNSSRLVGWRVQSSVNHLNLSKKYLMIFLFKFLNVNMTESTRKKYPAWWAGYSYEKNSQTIGNLYNIEREMDNRGSK